MLCQVFGMYYNTKSLSAQQKVTGPESFEARFSPEFRNFSGILQVSFAFPPLLQKEKPSGETGEPSLKIG